MVQIKIFRGTNTSQLTEEINEWIKTKVEFDTLTKSDDPAGNLKQKFAVLSQQMTATKMAYDDTRTQILITYEDGK